MYKCNCYTKLLKTLLLIISHEQEVANWTNVVSISFESYDFRTASSRWTIFSTHVPSPSMHDKLWSPLWHTTCTWWRRKNLKKSDKKSFLQKECGRFSLQLIVCIIWQRQFCFKLFLSLQTNILCTKFLTIQNTITLSKEEEEVFNVYATLPYT